MNGDTALDELRSERKERMRDFQERLTERLREATIAPRTAQLGLQIGEQRWLVHLAEAGEIVPMPAAITPVPLTRDWLVGLANLRGTLFAVADLQRFAGDVATPVAKEARLLAFSASLNVNAALIVTRMLGLHDPQGWTEDPSRQHWAAWAGRCLLDGEGRDWHELSLSRLAADEQFLSASR